MSSRLKFLFGLAAYTVVLRLMPYFVLTNHDHTTNPIAAYYPWNFMPLMALCLYSGATVKNRFLAVATPLIAQFATDAGILAFTGKYSNGFPNEIWAVYVSYILAVFLGAGLWQRSWPLRAVDALGRGILGEVIFFVVTNFAYFTVQTEHPHTAAGLITCYIAAIPFAGRAFLSTMFYSVLFFSPAAERAAGETLHSPDPLNQAQLP